MAKYNNVIVKRGDYGTNVLEIQKALYKIGYWPSYVPYSKKFGPTTDKMVRKFQKAKNITVDGKVGYTTASLLGIFLKPEEEFDEKWKGVTITGATFPDAPISWNVRVKLNKEIVEEYIPIMKNVMVDCPKGFQLLVTIMAYKEGFRPGTRSYRTNNPGNIGNTDTGANKHNGTLKSGIWMQRKYIERIITGQHPAYPLWERKIIQPYYSPEIAKHSKLYGMSPYIPGYDFIFDGSLEQFVKIYATGARGGNGYLSMILSYFKQNGIYISPQSRLQDIIKMNG